MGGTVIDGTGGTPIRNGVVLIRGERIEQVGPADAVTIPAGYTRVPTDGMTVLPGLWDMHVHLLYAGHTNLQYWHDTYTPRFEQEIMPATAQQLLRAGVTSVRDMGAPPDAIFGLKERIPSGALVGPTIYAAGPQMTHQPPTWARFYRWGVSGPADAAAKARQLLDRGADLLKITDAESMTVDEIRAITTEAHARGKKVAAHGRTNAEIKLGLDGAVDEFEHIGVGPNGAEYPAELIAAIKARAASAQPLYWAPTVGLPLGGDALRADAEWLDDTANVRGLPALIADDVRKAIAGFMPQPSPTPAITRKVAQLREAGVRLVTGTDGGLAGNPHSQATWRELDAWVRVLGIDPLATITAATGGAAVILGADREVGTLQAGKLADVLVVRGDVRQHIDTLRHPEVVYKRGRRVEP